MACGRLDAADRPEALGAPVSLVQLANSAGSARGWHSVLAMRHAAELGSGVGQRSWAAELGSGVGLRGLTTDG